MSTMAVYTPARGRAWPLVPLAPLVVVVIGVAVTLVVELIGIGYLARASDEHAGARAELLVAAEAARLGELTEAGREEAIRLAARRTGAEFLLVGHDGTVHVDASLRGITSTQITTALATGRGETRTGLGRARYAVRSVNDGAAPEAVLAFVRAPAAPEGGTTLITALLALTTLLLGVAATFAYAVARDANIDVEFLIARVRDMTRTRIEPSGETVPVRSMDEVGILTSDFNELVGRFVTAERGYRANLTRARAADRDRAAFLAAVSHELRSPLNAILGFADLLTQGVDGPLSPDAREEVDQIRGSGAHLLELINDILEFSALEGGQLKLGLAQVDVSAIAADVLREAAPLLAGKPVVARLDGESGVMAEADPKRVRQILTNLVGNAIKFTQRGEIVVRVARQGAYAKIAVKDTGPGIGEAERALIFEDYRQTAEEGKKRRGTGLGLAIARRLVLMHGGVIQLESELGHGSTFHVLLPLGPRRQSMRPPRP